MDALVALKEETVLVWDKSWGDVFTPFKPIVLFGGTTVLVINESPESTSKGMLGKIKSVFYPPILVLIPFDVAANMEKRDVSDEIVVPHKSDMCDHPSSDTERWARVCRSCFRKHWVEKAQQVKIEHECLKVKGKPLWIK